MNNYHSVYVLPPQSMQKIGPLPEALFPLWAQNHHQKNRRKVIHKGSSFRRFYPVRKGLQDVIRDINIFRDVAELISHIALIDGDVLIFEVRRIEGEVF